LRIPWVASAASALLYTLSRLQLTYAQQTRAYSLQLLLVCLSWYALLRALAAQSGQRRWWLCYVIASTLAMYTHLFSFLLVVAQLCAAVGIVLVPGPWRQQARRQLSALLTSVAVLAVLVIPMVLVSRQGAKTGWLAIPHPHALYALLVSMSSDSAHYLEVLLAWMVLGLVTALLVYVPTGRWALETLVLGNHQREERWRQLQHWLPVAVALLCWLLVPLAISYVVSQGPTRLFSARTLVVVLPASRKKAGLGIAVVRWRWVQVGVALSLILVFAARAVPGYYAHSQVEDWRSAAHWIQQQYQPGDGLVCYDNSQGCQTALEYYFDAYPGAAHFSADSPGANVLDANSPFHPGVNAQAAVDPTALARFGTRHPRLFFILARLSSARTVAQAQAAQQWLATHYQELAQEVTQGVTIRLYRTWLDCPARGVLPDQEERISRVCTKTSSQGTTISSVPLLDDRKRLHQVVMLCDSRKVASSRKYSRAYLESV
jgi:mannosyltransferase